MLLAALVCGVGASILGANHASAFLGGLFAPEIELISVELVDQKDQVEMDFFGPNTPRPPRPLLKVRLRTNPDIHDYIEQNDYSLHQFASICNGNAIDERQKIAGPLSVYDEAGHIWLGRSEGPPVMIDPSAPKPPEPVVPPLPTRKTAAQRIYHVYWPLKPWPNEDFQFDLEREPVDVCLLLRGGAMPLSSFTTNTIKIRKGVIREAIARGRSQKPAQSR
jgi:hypothetical protein